MINSFSLWVAGACFNLDNLKAAGSRKRLVSERSMLFQRLWGYKEISLEYVRF